MSLQDVDGSAIDDESRKAVSNRLSVTAISKWPATVHGYPRIAQNHRLGRWRLRRIQRQLNLSKIRDMPHRGQPRGVEYVPWVRNGHPRGRTGPNGRIGRSTAIIVVAEDLCDEIRTKYEALGIPAAGQLNLGNELLDIAWGVATFYGRQMSDQPTEEPRITDERHVALDELRSSLTERLAALHMHRQALHEIITTRNSLKQQSPSESAETLNEARRLINPPEVSDVFAAAWLHKQAAHRIAQSTDWLQ